MLWENIQFPVTAKVRLFLTPPFERTKRSARLEKKKKEAHLNTYYEEIPYVSRVLKVAFLVTTGGEGGVYRGGKGI